MAVVQGPFRLVAQPFDHLPRPRTVGARIRPRHAVRVDPQEGDEVGARRIDVEVKLGPADLEEERASFIHGDAQLVHRVEREVEPSGHAGCDGSHDLEGIGARRSDQGHVAGRLGHAWTLYFRAAGPPTATGPIRGGAVIDLSIEIEERGRWRVLRVGGEIDLYTSPQLRERLLEAAASAEAAPFVALDLTGVSFVDSSGLGVIVGGLKHVRERNGDLQVVASDDSPVAKLLSLTSLDGAIRRLGSIEELDA
jgi:anti-sigma B factor antagonist